MKKLMVLWVLSLLLLSSFAIAQEKQEKVGFFGKIINFFVKLFTPEPKEEVVEEPVEVKEETVLEEPEEVEEVEEKQEEPMQEPEEAIEEVKEPEMTASSGESSTEAIEELPEIKDSNNKAVPYSKDALGSKDSREYLFKDRKYTLEVFSAESTGDSILKVRDSSFRMKPGEFKHVEGLLIRNKGVVSDEGSAVPKIDLEVYYVGRENNYCTPNVQCDNDELVWTDCDRNRKIKIDACDEAVQKDSDVLRDSKGNIVAFVEGVFDKGSNSYSLGGKDFTLVVLGVGHTGEAKLDVDDQQFTLKTGEYKQVNGLLVLNRGARFDLVGERQVVTPRIALVVFYIGRENFCSPKVDCVSDKFVWTSCDRARTIKIGNCGTGLCESPYGDLIECDEIMEEPICEDDGTDRCDLDIDESPGSGEGE